MPVLISTVVIGQLWLKIYNPDYGILNVALRAIGLESWTKIWLGTKQTALGAVFAPTLWQYVGYHMLLMYAGVKSVSPDLREAAKIDGAGEYRTFFQITLPLMKPSLAAVGFMMATAYWNDWQNAFLFIDKADLKPLQLLLINIQKSIETLLNNKNIPSSAL